MVNKTKHLSNSILPNNNNNNNHGNNHGSGQEEPPSLHPISCNRCRSRHTKCDKLLPTCSYCMENNLPCIYETPKKLRKNYMAEFVDLNQNVVSSALTHLQNPQSKYKVYKFSVGEKKKKKRRERPSRNEHLQQHVVASSNSTLENMDSNSPARIKCTIY
ncbi:predicted protein [Naegleria gruberi]|uniref:Predicted protein n=1 Tax=Naegleria gruberi TaxID=5762 RepID=D2VEH9_NAEGR|nr:uncharacterized protein NAEGRDRAFT_67285 [Naegleria gruberi]EFC44802.1 predicted protein [Naegleria gruberi]|eukprot:XP_002677546.1 predicted protein [Naegleria gruberi strain NEG-M]